MTDEPWDSYERGALWSGWSYPVGRSLVDAALRDAGVHLLSLDFRCHGGDADDAEHPLMSADRYSDGATNLHLRRGTPERSRACLTLHAVPSALRPSARAVLLDEGVVARACAWLAAAEQARPTWRDKSHDWTAWLIGGRLRIVESER